jgi:hypothetical protein
MEWPAFAYLYTTWGYALIRAREHATERQLHTYLYAVTLNGEPFWAVSWDPKEETSS